MQSNIKSYLDKRNEERQAQKDQKVFNFIVFVVAVICPISYLLLVKFY
jgi:hypothetical protein